LWTEVPFVPDPFLNHALEPLARDSLQEILLVLDQSPISLLCQSCTLAAYGDFSQFEKNAEVSYLRDLFPVDLIARYIERKLAANNMAS
jgi:hypothetical protein